MHRKISLIELALHRLEFLKTKEKRNLSSLFANGESDLKRLTVNELEHLLGRRLRVKSLSLPEVIKAAERDYQWLESGQGFVLSVEDEDYPPLLKEIFDPPFLLFGRGKGALKGLAVAVVGTRLATGKAHRSCFEVSRTLAQNGVLVVSGLAKGIDATAHQGALAGGGQTAAVLGNGIDYVYPKENRLLAQKILEGGGLLLSEYPTGVEVRRYRFPQRNRIVSGMSALSVVVQAPHRSGSLITADQALEQGRDVVVLEAGLDDVYGEGTIRLAEEGAPIWDDFTDIESLLQRYKEIYGKEEKKDRFEGKEEEINVDYCRVSRKGSNN